MGLKAVKEYYTQVQSQYLEMLENIKDFDEALSAGYVDQEQFDQAQEMLNRVKENYERLSYIMYLFMQPNRKEKVAKFNRQNKQVHNFFSTSSGSKEAVLKENADTLKELKNLIKGAQK